MRVTPIYSISAFKFELHRPQPASFSELVEAMSKKATIKKQGKVAV